MTMHDFAGLWVDISIFHDQLQKKQEAQAFILCLKNQIIESTHKSSNESALFINKRSNPQPLFAANSNAQPLSLLQTDKYIEIQYQVKRHSYRFQPGKTAFSAE